MTWIEYYSEYRPYYSKDAIQKVLEIANLRAGSCIIDIGSGTGILSEQFISEGFNLIGVEPYDEMRELSSKKIKSSFTAVKGVAECSSLEEDIADLIVVGSSFHWFDFDKTLEEFSKILKKDCKLAILQNIRLTSKGSIEEKYEMIVEKSSIIRNKPPKIDWESVQHFFYKPDSDFYTFKNTYIYNFQELAGRFLSTSYLDFDKIKTGISELELEFDRLSINEKVPFRYQTQLLIGTLKTEPICID